MGKNYKHIFKNERFQLSEGSDGFWLYDFELGMNISMRAKTEQEAFLQALTYYQEKLMIAKQAYKVLDNKVQKFVSQFVEEIEENKS